jgi:hypothetical protein
MLVAMRSFVDSRGVGWRVWETTPGAIAQVLHMELRPGWLTFDSPAERRRLTPIPDDWLTVSSSALEVYCDSATRIPARLWRDLDIE